MSSVFLLRHTVLTLCLWLACGAAPAEQTAATVLITGSNRGIGLELARAYAARGWKVIATCRQPRAAAELQALAAADSDVVVEALDVADHAMIDALAARYRGQPIDVLINNAGISGGSAQQRFGALNYDVYRQVLEVNAVAPIKVAEAFVEHVKAGKHRKIVAVSSSEGSIAGAEAPRLYWYRSSKAALNMLMRNLALELRGQGISVAMLNPGPTDTDMMKGARMPLRKVDVAARDLITLIDALTLETTGSYLNYDGEALPW